MPSLLKGSKSSNNSEVIRESCHIGGPRVSSAEGGAKFEVTPLVGELKIQQFQPVSYLTVHIKNLFCSLAVLDPRVGYSMNVLSQFISIFCQSD